MSMTGFLVNFDPFINRLYVLYTRMYCSRASICYIHPAPIYDINACGIGNNIAAKSPFKSCDTRPTHIVNAPKIVVLKPSLLCLLNYFPMEKVRRHYFPMFPGRGAVEICYHFAYAVAALYSGLWAIKIYQQIGENFFIIFREK